jgi:hypothetical protein
MWESIISEDFEITLPRELCEQMGWLPGHRLGLVVESGALQLVDLGPGDEPEEDSPASQ